MCDCIAIHTMQVEPSDLGVLLAGRECGSKAGSGGDAPITATAWSHSLWAPTPSWAATPITSTLLLGASCVNGALSFDCWNLVLRF